MTEETKSPRGRKKGSLSSTEGTNSFLYDALGKLEIGGYVYLETEYETVQRIRSRVTVNDSRKPQFIRGRKFTSGLFTAVSAVNPSKIQYLIRIERIA